MSTFVDTSALLPLLNSADPLCPAADDTWQSLLDAEQGIVCSSYVLVETWALLQNRLGLQAVRLLNEDICPALGVVWVTQEIHDAAVAAVLAANRRQLSLVDCVSFEVMRRLGIRPVFAFDPHFAEYGFECLPDAHSLS